MPSSLMPESQVIDNNFNYSCKLLDIYLGNQIEIISYATDISLALIIDVSNYK